MIELLNEPLALITFVGLLGLFVGSFLNVVIYRLPKMMENEWAVQAAELRGETVEPPARFNLATPRSRCPHCATPVSTIDNVPLLSYLMLRGRCRHCQAPISRRYPVVELATAVLSALAAWKFGNSAATIGAVLFIWAMIALAGIDLDTQLLPDAITLPLIWLGLLFNLGGVFAPLADAVIGAMAGYLSLWSVFHLFRLVTGKEGMGYGDFKLLAAIGAWLGWQMLPLTILLSSVVGAVVGVGLMLFARHGRNTPIPFGPYLAAAGLIALFAGDALNARYLQLL
ncbi:prepilin peptidase [Denitromonas iodatirespirans]|uniref:Prepilin leader peptidase/N-methyltransferase n=1 Tax=Denitromonas iodatirespirans TaxID=2795389 RepID=A0A944H7R2_DENI1|nr:A24 family peptidase [Denitromonas iodatirespirans]MBT0960565.1 prepilin peptidase [Denitromonas iodatirespirans]